MKSRIWLVALGGWLSISCQIALGDFTIDTKRLAVSCESGSKRCAGNQVQACVAGNEWRMLATCDTADQCNLRSLGCATCVPGSYQCSDSQPQVCDASSHWVNLTPAPCASASLCDVPEDGSAAKCLSPECPVAGELRCLDGHLQRCPLSQKTWEDVEICASAALCDLGQANEQVAAGKPPTCVLPACAPGQYNCETGSPQPCKADRTGWDPATTSCAGSTCNPQKGDCSQCATGSFVCSGRNLERCSEQQTWESTECPSALSCNAAMQECDPPKCTPGEFLCTEQAALQRCSGDGTKLEPIEQCQNRFLCNPKATRCEVPRCPRPGAKRCEGNTWQTCREDLTSWAEVADCPALGRWCDPVLGCVEKRCDEGSYRCNDVSLESCTNGTWARSATCQTTALCDAANHQCREASCAPGERKCQGNVLLRCNTARDGWEDLDTCRMGKICNPDTTRCEQH